MNKRPKEYVKTIDRITNLAFNQELKEHLPVNTAEPVSISVGKAGKKPQLISVGLQLFYDAGYVRHRPLTAGELTVLDAVTTLIANGHKVITLREICDVMRGESRSGIRQPILQEILAVLKSLMATLIVIDGQGFRYTGPLLGAEILSEVREGDPVLEQTYIRLTQNALWDFASKRNQIIRGNINLLNIPLHQSKTILALRDYLVRRIQRKSQKKEITILHQSIHEILQIDIKNRTVKARIRKYTKTILEHWKGSLIHDFYEADEEGKKITTKKAPFKYIVQKN